MYPAEGPREVPPGDETGETTNIVDDWQAADSGLLYPLAAVHRIGVRRDCRDLGRHQVTDGYAFEGRLKSGLLGLAGRGDIDEGRQEDELRDMFRTPPWVASCMRHPDAELLGR